MKTANALLAEGIQALREKDEDIERLIAPRSEEFISLLERYIKEIEFFNPSYGLVGAGSTGELVIKHILDSLSPLGIIFRLLSSRRFFASAGEENLRPQIADAGSGAGLPGIPLSIAMPMCSFTLIERMERRTGFLWNTKACLGLSGVNVEEGELEKTQGGRFALVTFRAFKPLDSKLLKPLFRALSAGGVIAAYKGRLEKIKLEMAPLEKSCGHWEAVPYSVPFLDEERHLLIITPP